MHENASDFFFLSDKWNFPDTLESRYLEVDGTIFYKFKLPEVQINLHFL